MKKRSAVSVFLLSMCTFGIYAIVWFVNTKDEMNEKGAEIPTAWLLWIPFVSLYWHWKWCGGVDHVTKGKTSQASAFLLILFLSFIGIAIVQDGLNKAIDLEKPAELPVARVV